MTAEQTISERVENVLVDHWSDEVTNDCIDGKWVWARHCDCGWVGRSGLHSAHVAEQIAAVLAPVVAEAKAEALREAAEDWQVGGWSNVLLPAPTPPAVPVIAYSNRVLDWLRDRVEQIGQA